MVREAMHNFARLSFMLPVAIGAFIAGCSVIPHSEVVDVTCDLGRDCTLVGELTIFIGSPASVGVIDTEAGCVPLALPEQLYNDYDKWNRRKVEVTGIAYRQSDDPLVVWYYVKDRMVATSMCDAPIILYVKEIGYQDG